MPNRTAFSIVGALAILSTALPADAQIRASEAGVMSQTVDGTTITIAYSRPVARGRTLFGDLVPWGGVWTPGANRATTLEADHDVIIEGVEVPAGRYSVWMIPRAGAPWTLTLNPDPNLYHFQKPDSTADQIHVAVRPTEDAAHSELLTWSFPAVSGDGAVLRMQWGTTAVPINVVVQPSRTVTLAPEERARFLGSYDMTFLPGIGWPTSAQLDVFEEDGMLRGRLPFDFHPGDEHEFDLIPAGEGRFSPGLYRKGKLFNVEPSVTIEFDFVDDRATVAKVRGGEGTVFGEGPRIET